MLHQVYRNPRGVGQDREMEEGRVLELDIAQPSGVVYNQASATIHSKMLVITTRMYQFGIVQAPFEIQLIRAEGEPPHDIG